MTQPKPGRRTYLIDRRFQLKYTVLLVLCGTLISVLFGTLAYLAEVDVHRSLAEELTRIGGHAADVVRPRADRHLDHSPRGGAAVRDVQVCEHAGRGSLPDLSIASPKRRAEDLLRSVSGCDRLATARRGSRYGWNLQRGKSASELCLGARRSAGAPSLDGDLCAPAEGGALVRIRV